MSSKNEDTRTLERLGSLERRDFLRAAAAAAATGAVTPSALFAEERSVAFAAIRGERQERQEAPLVPLGNGEPPALLPRSARTRSPGRTPTSSATR